jgi:hemerythrin-like domain-containing protein
MNSKAALVETAPVSQDGFEVLDAVHRQTLAMLDKLATLVPQLVGRQPDAAARAMAAEIVQFFSGTARQHHEDEERHVFRTLLASDDAETVQAVQRLQQDHFWLEEDWLELAPLLDAVAAGQSWYDPDTLREGVEIFTALSQFHVAVEESCIYPQARQRMSAAERQRMGLEIAARRRDVHKSRQARPD